MRIASADACEANILNGRKVGPYEHYVASKDGDGKTRAERLIPYFPASVQGYRTFLCIPVNHRERLHLKITTFRQRTEQLQRCSFLRIELQRPSYAVSLVRRIPPITSDSQAFHPIASKGPARAAVIPRRRTKLLPDPGFSLTTAEILAADADWRQNSTFENPGGM